MPVLQIVIGETTPILRKKTEKVSKVTGEIKKLIRDMKATVKKAEGLGIAAPQVGKSFRLCLAQFNGKMTPLINPSITWKGEETSEYTEGCLSLPDIEVKVRRAEKIIVVYTDEKNDPQERRLEGIDARVVQHELDHLDGVLIVDYQD